MRDVAAAGVPRSSSCATPAVSTIAVLDPMNAINLWQRHDQDVDQQVADHTDSRFGAFCTFAADASDAGSFYGSRTHGLKA